MLANLFVSQITSEHCKLLDVEQEMFFPVRYMETLF